jgi:hypothetical protein
MGFGLAATDDDEIIAAGGHDFNYETMVDINILDTHADKLEWKNLPDMPSKVLHLKMNEYNSFSKVVLSDQALVLLIINCI